jgi:RNA polymerase-binding transcription factor DksA
MLTREDLGRFRQRLESERDAIKSRMAERSRDSKETVREDSGVGDSGDEATRLNDLDVEADENQVDRGTLAQISRALGRIDGGTYGVSEFSGKPIPRRDSKRCPTRRRLSKSRHPSRANDHRRELHD